jgi:hypothetical protein
MVYNRIFTLFFAGTTMMDMKEYAQFCHRYQADYKTLMDGLEDFKSCQMTGSNNEEINLFWAARIHDFLHLEGIMDKPEYLHLMLKEKDFFESFPLNKTLAYSFISCWSGDYQLNFLFSEFTYALDKNMLSLLKSTGEDDYFKQALKGNHQFVYYLGEELTYEHFEHLEMLENHFQFSILKQPGNIMPVKSQLVQGNFWRYMTQLPFAFQASDVVALNYTVEKEHFLQARQITMPDMQKVHAIEKYFQQLLNSPYGNNQEEYAQWLDNMKVYKKRLLYGKLDNSLQDAIISHDMAPEYKFKL